MLAAPEICELLLALELVSTDLLTSPDFEILDTSGRNSVALVAVGGTPAFVVKQGGAQSSGRSLAAEASAYRSLVGTSAARRHLVPHCLHFDPALDLLVTDQVTQSRGTLSQMRQGRGPFSLELARHLGRLTGQLTRDIRSPTFPDLIDTRAVRPLALGLSIVESSLYSSCSRGQIALIGLFQQEIAPLVEALCFDSDPSQLIHGDMRFDNLVVRSRRGERTSDDNGRIALIDWEFAGLGDPAWDVGSIFGEYFAAWLRTVPITALTEPRTLASAARHPLALVSEAAGAYWTSFCHALGSSADTHSGLLDRAANYMALRLVQAAYEGTRNANDLDGYALYLVQLAWNILEQPDDALVHLLGIRDAA